MPPYRKYLSKPRRFVKRTTAYKPRRTNAVGAFIPRGIKWRPTQLFKISQIYDAAINNSLSTPISVAYSFALSALDQSSTFTSIFDQYRIHNVTLSFKPRVTQATTITSAIGANIYSAIDYDDANIPASLAAIREYQSCQENGPLQSFSRSFTPRCALAAYSGAFTSFANVGNMWLDAGSPNIQHYGLKVWSNMANALQTWDVICEMQCEFRNVH